MMRQLLANNEIGVGQPVDSGATMVSAAGDSAFNSDQCSSASVGGAEPQQIRKSPGELAEITTPTRLMEELRRRDLSALLPKLWPNAERRLAVAELTVSELIVSACWLGIEPPVRAFRDYRTTH